MKWRRGTGSQVEDRRGAGGFPMPGGMRGGVGGGIGLIVLVLTLLLGGNVLGGGSGGGIDVGPGLEPLPEMPGPGAGAAVPGAPDSDAELIDFLDFVVKDVEDSWVAVFQRAGQEYERKKLVVFSQATQTGCGFASAQTGPFYCPLDRRVYLDLSFFRELRDRFGAPGDFAQAYVIAHEYGHHVQNLLGISDRVRRAQQEDPDQANEYSIRLELQADCLAGVWAHSAYKENLLEPGDLEEGLTAAAAVGDDRIQSQSTGRIDQESWTHGSSEQRTQWFQRGFDEGDPEACDTFSADEV